MTIIRKLLRTDGTSMDLESSVDFPAIRALLDAAGLDTVPLRHLGEPLHVMLVDDNGWEYEVIELSPNHFEHRPTRPRKPLNAEATRLYHLNCRPGVQHQIVGDVLILPDDDFA